MATSKQAYTHTLPQWSPASVASFTGSLESLGTRLPANVGHSLMKSRVERNAMGNSKEFERFPFMGVRDKR